MTDSAIIIDIQGREQGAKRIKRNLDEISDSGDKAKRSVFNLKNAIVAIGSAVAVRAIIGMADSMTNLRNRMRLVTDGTSQLNAVQAQLFEIANSTRSSYEATAEVYNRTALATKELGLSQQETLNFTKSLNQAVILSGASAQEAQAGLIQLSQGLASGTLRGDELRSVLEQLPAVSDVIAKSLGITRGELRKMGEDGKITADIIIEAFRQASGDLESKFGTTVPTVSQALTVLKNSFMQLIQAFDSSTSSTSNIAQAILWIAKNIKYVPKALLSLEIVFVKVFGNFTIGMNAIANTSKAIFSGIGAVIDLAARRFSAFGEGLKNFAEDPLGGDAFTKFDIQMQRSFTDVFKRAYNDVQTDTYQFADDMGLTIENKILEISKSIEQLNNPTFNGANLDVKGQRRVKPAELSKEAQKAAEETLKRQKALLDSIKPSLADYKQTISDLNVLYNAGKISINEYNDALNTQNLDFVAGTKTFTFADSYKQQLDIMKMETKDASVELGKTFGEVFGEGGELQKGIGSAISGAIIYGKSWKESIGEVARSISEKLLTQLVEVGIQLIFNTQKQLAFNAAAGSGGGGKGSLFGSILGAVAGSFTGGGALGSQGGLSRTIAGGGSSFIGPVNGFGGFGFASGGYTGNGGKNSPAGVVHGQEFVNNAASTKQYRPILEAMNSGSFNPMMAGGNKQLKVIVENNIAGAEYDTQVMDENTVRIIARREAKNVVRSDAPDIIASDIANPNGRTSKSLNSNFNNQRRRN